MCRKNEFVLIIFRGIDLKTIDFSQKDHIKKNNTKALWAHLFSF